MLEAIGVYCKNMQNLENLDVFEILITQNLLKFPEGPFCQIGAHLYICSVSGPQIAKRYHTQSRARLNLLPSSSLFSYKIDYSNAIAFVTRHLIGKRQKVATVIILRYTVGNCRHQLRCICCMTCGFMRLATLQFETKMQKCSRMGMTIFKI